MLQIAQALAQCNNITYMAITMIREPASDSVANANRRLDQLGIGLAGLCALHCLATIVVVSVLGIGGHFLLAPEIHRVGLAIALVVAAVAIGWGALRHRRAAPFVIAMMGLTFMGGALAMPHGDGEIVLTMIGVALVALGHLLNIRSASR
ncbi:hypothetical protein CD351_02250 [Erythrobacter sp. KY5]|nr:hypothetical protein CD351_02250 [Erythrobacter sp. KY5]